VKHNRQIIFEGPTPEGQKYCNVNVAESGCNKRETHSMVRL
jgi:hypothetical protein